MRHIVGLGDTICGNQRRGTREPLGEETLSVRGAPLNARRYAVHPPKFRIDLWYADANWVQLESRTDGGQLLRYEIE